MVQDISRGGMNLIVQDQVDPGTLLKIEGEDECSAPGPLLWVRVIHVVPAEDGSSILGCVFPHELGEEELKYWGGRRLQPDHQDYWAWVRFPCDAQATFRPSAASDPGEWQAQVVNISPSGIGLVVSKCFQPGTMLNIALPIPSDQMFRTILACVVHVTPCDEGKWTLGCSFATDLNDEDLQTFGVNRVKSPDEDCRTWVRCPCGMEMAYSPRDGHALQSVGLDSSLENEGPWPAKVSNISANGIGLVVSRPVEPGALLNVELHRGDNSHALLACVVYVKELEDGQWLLGCTFASDLNLAL